MLAWNMFSWTLSKTSMSMVGNSYLVSKVYFPRLILPLSGTLSTMLDLVVSLAMMLVLFFILRRRARSGAVRPADLDRAAAVLALGAGLMAASMTVDYRDVQHILAGPDSFHAVCQPRGVSTCRTCRPGISGPFFIVNPLAGLIDGFRWSLAAHAATADGGCGLVGFVSIGLFMLGAAVFRRTERKLADVI